MDIRTKRLIEAFEASNLTQTEICEKTGINKGAMSSYLSGRYFPKQRSLEKLASALNVKISYLMGIEEDDDDFPKTIAAHHDNDEWTEEELQEIEQFKAYVKSKREK